MVVIAEVINVNSSANVVVTTTVVAMVAFVHSTSCTDAVVAMIDYFADVIEVQMHQELCKSFVRASMCY